MLTTDHDRIDTQVRFKGDADKVEAVYDGYQELTAIDIAANIVWACRQPPHVNLQLLHVMPTAQGGATRIHRQPSSSS